MRLLLALSLAAFVLTPGCAGKQKKNEAPPPAEAPAETAPAPTPTPTISPL